MDIVLGIGNVINISITRDCHKLLYLCTWCVLWWMYSISVPPRSMFMDGKSLYCSHAQRNTRQVMPDYYVV